MDNLFCDIGNVLSCIINVLSSYKCTNTDLRTQIMRQGPVTISRPLGLKQNMPKKGFYYSALKAWNDSPANIREIQTLGHIKK